MSKVRNALKLEHKTNSHTIGLDQLLWDTINLDDEKAFEQLFELFYPPLLGYARKYIYNRSMCEDIVQGVFVSLWENRKTLHITQSARNYLLVSVRNHCLNFLKKERLTHQYQEFALKAACQKDNENFYLLTELYEMLDKALAKLPDTYRRVFEMHRIEKKSYEDIAEELHISVRTAKRYQSYVMEVLKKDLKDYLPFLIFHLEFGYLLDAVA
jgi:RNA polymerase sigma-70 factor (ECF subfamily)